MLRWTIIFLVVAIIAAILGFGGIAAGAASIAKILFYIFLVLFVLSLIAGGFRRVDWCILSYMEVQLYCTFFCALPEYLWRWPPFSRNKKSRRSGTFNLTLWWQKKKSPRHSFITSTCCKPLAGAEYHFASQGLIFLVLPCRLPTYQLRWKAFRTIPSYCQLLFHPNGCLLARIRQARHLLLPCGVSDPAGRYRPRFLYSCCSLMNLIISQIHINT